MPSHWHEQISIGDNEKNNAIVTFFLYLQMVNCASECSGESKKVELITKANTKVFTVGGKWMVGTEVLELAALILL